MFSPRTFFHSCSSEENLKSHMKRDHDDGAWTCEDCDFQTNTSEPLRQHLKKTGHQPSEATKRQTNEIRQCHTCKENFEGYVAMMDHRFAKHPSNKICRNIPICTGWINGKQCWYVHPTKRSDKDNTDTDKASPPGQQAIECRRCGTNFRSRNQFMTHYTTKQAGNIFYRDWLKHNCRRVECWYLHSNAKPKENNILAQVVPTQQDFFQPLPPPQPPTQGQPRVQSQINKQSEMEVGESRKQLHILQQMLANTVL